jgi:ElaB/YqjD/DUF883 family membrane-anchored ribosome-binding protein
VLSQTGFDKYKAINVQYAGQVIGIRNTGNPKTDTAQLRLNVEKLLRQARDMQDDSLMAVREIKEQKLIQVDPSVSATEKETAAKNKSKQAESNHDNNPVLVANPVSMKHFSDPKKEEKPKAVMTKQSQ